MRTAVALVLALAWGGCGGSRQERAYCERLGTLCTDEPMSAKEVAECSAELADTRAALGAEAYDRLLGCGIAAGSCMEILGCMGGAVAILGEHTLDELERGFEKMRPPSDMEAKAPGRTPASDVRPLPPECERANTVCGEGERLIRDACIDMVENLKADPENREKLVRCYEGTKNCFAFDKCTSDLWFALH